MVVEGLRNASHLRQEPPFFMLANALMQEDIEVKNLVLQLITIWIGSLEDPSDRTQLRAELDSCNIGTKCSDIVEAIELLYPAEEDKPSHSSKNQRYASSRIDDTDYDDTNLHFSRVKTVAVVDKEPISMYGNKLPDIVDFDTDTSRLSLGSGDIVRNSSSDSLVTPGETEVRSGWFKIMSNPLKGRMAGALVMPKRGKCYNFQIASQTKMRWFEIDYEKLAWCHSEVKQHQPGTSPQDCIPAEFSGSISIASITSVQSWSSNANVNFRSPHTFEIVANGITYCFGAKSEEDKQKWLLAIQASRENYV